VSPPTRGGPLTIVSAPEGKLLVRNQRGRVFVFDPVSARFEGTE
jgi:hypothetical protein